jgi:hypothetical protein
MEIASILNMENFNICNSIFIGTQKFNFDKYGIINTDFGCIQQLDNSIKVINTTKIDMPVNCPCGECNIVTKKINPWDTIYNIPAKVYGDIIRFKKAGWKNIKIITCNETRTQLPVIRLPLTIFKKHFNIKKYILPFYYNKYKSNITALSYSHKHFEFILHEEKTDIPAMNCCIFDDNIDNKAVYITMAMMSAQLGGKKVWYAFDKKEGLNFVSFKVS